MRHDGKKGRTDQKPAKKKTIRNVHNKKASGTNMNKSAKNRADHSNPQRSVRKKKANLTLYETVYDQPQRIRAAF